ncbi:MAG: helix-turn-helix domain-containing protein [Bacteroidales bacterium]
MANLKKIKDLCDIRNITQVDLAKAVNLSRQSIVDMMERNSTKTEILERISKVLNVPVSYFFDEIITTGNHTEESKSDQLIKTQNDLIDMLKKENAALKIELEDERKSKRLPSGYALASEPQTELKK